MNLLKSIFKQLGYLVALILVVGFAKGLAKASVKYFFNHDNAKYDAATVERVWQEQELMGLKLDLPTKLVEDKSETDFPPDLEKLLVSYPFYQLVGCRYMPIPSIRI